jgi:hypothetical protein
VNEEKKPKEKSKVEKLHDESVQKLGKGTRKETPGRKDRGEDYRKPGRS